MERRYKRSTRKKKKILLTILGIATVVIGYFGYDMTRYETTDDAYVETTMVSVAPKISGEIVEVYVKDNDYVKAGQPIAKIDTSKTQ